MKESDPNEAAVSQPKHNLDKADNQDFITVAGRDKKVRKTTVLFVSLFVIGLGVLFFMIRQASPESASAATAGNDETQLETAISRITGVRTEMFNRMDQIVNKFYEFSDLEQISVEELLKNPFKNQIFLESLFNVSSNSAINNTGKDKDDLELISIMQTDKGYCCMINEKILYQGDTIRQYTVKSITDNEVEVETNGFNLILKLTE
jgi:hypothetical protein